MQTTKRAKYVTVLASLGNNLPANSVTESAAVTTDKAYPIVTGVIAKVITPAGGNTYLETGVTESTNGARIDAAHQDILDATSSVAKSDRFTPIWIPNDGRSVKGVVKNPALTTNALGVVAFIFRLEDTEEQRPDLL